MNKLTILSILSLIFICACSESNNKQVKNAITHQNLDNKKPQEVSANRLLVAELSGMVCEMGCGGSIRKEMLKTNAVEQCKFDFVTDRKTNTVEIAFDKDKISVDKLISIISNMNDKQFKVIDFTTKVFKSKKEISAQELNSETISSNDEAKIKVETPTFNSFNLLSLLSHLISA